MSHFSAGLSSTLAGQKFFKFSIRIKTPGKKKNAVFLDAVKNAKMAVTQTTPRKLRIRVRCELSATHLSLYPERCYEIFWGQEISTPDSFVLNECSKCFNKVLNVLTLLYCM